MPWEAAEARRLLTAALGGEAEMVASNLTSAGEREQRAGDTWKT
jgi:hypothetical protein